MERTAKLMAVLGISGAMVISMCVCRCFGGTPKNGTQQQIKSEVYVVLATAANAVAMPDASKEDAIVVTVTRDGAIYLGINRIDMSDMGLRVRDMLADKILKETYIRVDARAKFRAVEDVINSLSAADVNDVGLLVRRTDADAPQSNKESQKFSAGLGLAVLSPSMMNEYLPKGITESMDRVQILRGRTGTPAYKINQTDVPKAELLPRLTEMYKNRGERILFLRGDDDLDFASVVEVVDIARSADIDHVALLTPQMAAGH
jgi:biopolymer transport protein TolR